MSHWRERLTGLLVGYYGLLQLAHLMLLARAGLQLLSGGGIGFPAPPPSGGWQEQATHFLIGMGLVDAVNVPVSLLFVYGYFARAAWRDRVGTLALTISAYSAVAFLYGTAMSGAWADNLLDYFVVAFLFAPAVVLSALFLTDRVPTDAP